MRLQDVVPRPFDRITAEMNDAVDAFAHRLDLGHVGQIGRLEFLVLAEIGGRLEVAQQQIRIDRRQQLAQARADSTGSAGHQNTWHLIPHLKSFFQYDAACDARQARLLQRYGNVSK
jgi:hypothetical protein